MLFAKAFGGSYNSAYYVMNTSGSPNTLTVKYFDTDGNLTLLNEVRLGAFAGQEIWVPSVLTP